jgi:hypothetical protein
MAKRSSERVFENDVIPETPCPPQAPMPQKRKEMNKIPGKPRYSYSVWIIGRAGTGQQGATPVT